MNEYPQQYIYYENSQVVGVATIYSPLVTVSGPPGSTEFILIPPNFAIEPGWKVSFDMLNNPTFSAP